MVKTFEDDEKIIGGMIEKINKGTATDNVDFDKIINDGKSYVHGEKTGLAKDKVNTNDPT